MLAYWVEYVRERRGGDWEGERKGEEREGKEKEAYILDEPFLQILNPRHPSLRIDDHFAE